MPFVVVAVVLTAVVRFPYHVTGTDDPSGFWYLWWSGFFPDIVLIIGVGTWVRHHRCQKDDCRYRHLPTRRLAFRHYEGSLLCREHNPAHHRLTDEHLAALWRHHREHAVLPHEHECAGGPAERALVSSADGHDVGS
jgi:hypothetical protein